MVDAIISVARDETVLLQIAVGANHPIIAVRLNDLLNSIRPVSALFFVVPRYRYYYWYTGKSYNDLDGLPVTPSGQVADLPQCALCIDRVEEALGEVFGALEVME